ncbi:DNA primase [Actinocatenispora rupis]|nr:DNA primase [Actinocatenispora rupis]
MAGRIVAADIAAVREKVSIVEVIGGQVTLRPAGGGNLKGLCPFHEEKSPSFNVTPERGFYHCLAGETRVLTREGVREIRDLAGGVHEVLGPQARWVKAPFKSYGTQRLWRVRVGRNGQTKDLYATDEHRWFVRSGADRRSRREVLTADLRPDHRLAYVYPPNHSRQSTLSPFGIAHGITFGDGTENSSGAVALLVGDKDAQLRKWFPNSFTSAAAGHDNAILVHHLPRFFKKLPELTESVPYLLGWLAGYFAADGCVAADGTVMLNSAKRANLEFVRDLCTRLGIGTYGITQQRRAGFPGREESSLYRVHFANTDLTEDFFLIEEHRQRFNAAEKKFDRRGWVVKSVERTDRVEEVFCAEVEDGHAFVLEDNILTGNCFGCGKGGDAISFLMEVDHLSFTESVERLAGMVGLTLRYEEGVGPRGPRGGDGGSKKVLVAAHADAAAFYAERLAAPDAQVAREFLAARGFDREAAARYQCGFAPDSWDALTRHLRTKGYDAKDLITAGLVREARSGNLIDRFRGRLMWPIRDLSGDVIGFGARKLLDSDDGPKYLNTPETPIYKKSHVLYGIDQAKREIAKQGKVVIVEGYTDVMACHLAGVPTAVATCGTSFGDDHIGVLRRLLMDSDEFRGEIIFTFDGDAAGQKAALRAFADDLKFVAHTSVAIGPDNMDPCELRLAKGDAAVRDLVADSEPLIDFALRSVLSRYDLDTAEGQAFALRSAAPMVAAIKEEYLRPRYVQKLAGHIGIEVEEARRAVNDALRAGGKPGRPEAPARPRPAQRPDGPQALVEREALKLAVQYPALAGPLFDAIDGTPYGYPMHRAIREAIAAVGGAAATAGGPGWIDEVRSATADLAAQALVSELAVEPLRYDAEPDPRYVSIMLARLQLPEVERRIRDIKSKVQRMNPVERKDEYLALFGELASLEQHARGLREQAVGGL